MVLTQTQIITLQQNLLDIAHEYVQYYISDLIIDFEYLRRLNNDGILPETLIFITRKSGTELGRIDDGNILYYLNSGSTELTVYEIDIKKLSQIALKDYHCLFKPSKFLFKHYSDLRKYGCPSCVIKLVQTTGGE